MFFRTCVLVLSHARLPAALEPLAALATQPAWQAGEPMVINVHADGASDTAECILSDSASCGARSVPAFGPEDILGTSVKEALAVGAESSWLHDEKQPAWIEADPDALGKEG
eukprot:5957672-Prorocentrum_lima.AAC.1